MEKLELNIPSKYSHGIFKKMEAKSTNEAVGYERVKLTQKQINYFYAIVYLYREKLLFVKQNSLIQVKSKDENSEEKTKHKLDDTIVWNDTKISIKFKDIYTLIYGEHNSQFDTLNKFKEVLESLMIETNLLGKDKSEKTTLIKIIDSIDVSKNTFSITMNDEFIKPYLITEKLFKKVNLNLLFSISGKNTKTLYLILKDYVGISPIIEDAHIKQMVAEMFSNGRITEAIEYINTQTDISVVKNENSKYTIKAQLWFENEEEEYEYYLRKYIWNESVKIMEVKNLNKSIDEDDYTKGIFKKIYKYQKEKYTLRYDIYRMLENLKDRFQSEVDMSEDNATVVFNLNDEYKSFSSLIIGDDYNLYGYPFPTQVTFDLEETNTILDKYYESEFIVYDLKQSNYQMSSIVF